MDALHSYIYDQLEFNNSSIFNIITAYDKYVIDLIETGPIRKYSAILSYQSQFYCCRFLDVLYSSFSSTVVERTGRYKFFWESRGSTQAKNKSKKNKSDDNIDDGNEDFDDEIYVRVEDFTLSASSSSHHQATEIT